MRIHAAAPTGGLADDLPELSSDFDGEEGAMTFEELEDQETEYWRQRACNEEPLKGWLAPLKTEPTPVRKWTKRDQEIADGDRDVT